MAGVEAIKGAAHADLVHGRVDGGAALAAGLGEAGLDRALPVVVVEVLDRVGRHDLVRRPRKGRLVPLGARLLLLIRGGRKRAASQTMPRFEGLGEMAELTA